MQHDIGTQPVTITLPAYRGMGVNDGSVKDLAALYGNARRPLLISFVNASAASAGDWLALLPGIKSESCHIFVVVFKHDGSTFVPCDADEDAARMVRAAGPGDEAFQFIPVVVDADGAVARSYLSGLPTDPADKDTWSYLIDPAFRIADKWHTSALSPAYPISFKHIRLDPDPGPFNGGVRENVRAYLLKRISLLNAPLVILGAKPAPGSTVRAAHGIRKVFFSRPLLESSVTPEKFMLTGPGLVGGSIRAVSALYQGYERAENGVLLDFPAGPLFKGLGVNAVVLVVSNGQDGILDSSGGALSGDHTVAFKAEPVFTPAVPAEEAEPEDRMPVFESAMEKQVPQENSEASFISRVTVSTEEKRLSQPTPEKPSPAVEKVIAPAAPSTAAVSKKWKRTGVIVDERAVKNADGISGAGTARVKKVPAAQKPPAETPLKTKTNRVKKTMKKASGKPAVKKASARKSGAANKSMRGEKSAAKKAVKKNVAAKKPLKTKTNPVKKTMKKASGKPAVKKASARKSGAANKSMRGEKRVAKKAVHKQ